MTIRTTSKRSQVNKQHLYCILGIILAIVACRKSDDWVDISPFTGFQKARNFPEPVYNFATNKITEAGFNLGKKLFYEPLLSRNNTISCGSCHISYYAFTHHGHTVSHGIEDKEGIRNALPLMNLAWNESFFWDGGVHNLDLSSVAPIENPVEMDEKLSNVVLKLQKNKEYPGLFKAAFGTEGISSERMLKALSQFMLLLISDQSKYDKVQRGEGGMLFTAEEQAGYLLFKKHCNTCHSEPLFTDQSFRDIGLGLNPAKDYGRYDITLHERDKLKFKVPSLRNLKYTAPYMHDGSYLTLAAVMQQFQAGSIKLNNEETTQILAFLETLNDAQFTLDKRFAE